MRLYLKTLFLLLLLIILIAIHLVYRFSSRRLDAKLQLLSREMEGQISLNELKESVLFNTTEEIQYYNNVSLSSGALSTGHASSTSTFSSPSAANTDKQISPTNQTIILESSSSNTGSSSSIQSGLFPEDSTFTDRILTQLEFRPKKLKKTELQIYSPSGFGLRDGKEFTGCPISNCRYVSGIGDQDEADAIIFHERIHMARLERTSKNAHQVWIYHSLESAQNRPISTAFPNVINWTATYRWDSDIVTPYGKFKPDPPIFSKVYQRNRSLTAYEHFFLRPDLKNITDYSTGKSGFVLWFVSNCGAPNNRGAYAHRLKEYIQVDIYGACGERKCPKHGNCAQELYPKYYFYLSFENTNCKGYITEKFQQNGLGHNLVPIVMGGTKEDYLRTSPPYSFIHVEDFPSARALADYLHFLIKHPIEYSKYLTWKGTGSFIDTRFYCRMCALLNEPPRLKSYPNFGDWWNGPTICRASIDG